MWVRIVKIILPLAILFFIPFVDPKGYLIYLTTTMLIFSILASSLNLLMGYTGLSIMEPFHRSYTSGTSHYVWLLLLGSHSVAMALESGCPA
jgi:ABC-type branched-subunit amino acid transport system permease subunit